MAVSLIGCRENDISDHPSPEQNIPEGMTQVSLLIPDYQGNSAKFGTRAYDITEEGYMSNLYVIAVRYATYDADSGQYVEVNSEDRTVYTFALNPVGERFELSNDQNKNGSYEESEKDYHKFNITLYPGKYRFGVLANVDLYLDRVTKISEFTKESQLNDIVLNFDENTPLTPLHLPMVCMPDKIRFSEEETTVVTNGDEKKTETTSGPIQNPSDGIITIHKNTPVKSVNTHLWIDMTFLCSKVRYTIMFDKTEGGISESFGESWIRFNVDDTRKPFVTNIRRQTQLFEGLSKGGDDNPYNVEDPFVHSNSGSNDEGQWFMSINRYYWPGPEWSTDPEWKSKGKSHGNEGNDYPVKPDSELEPWDKSTAEWVPMKQKVWQGVVYLPENKGFYKDAEDNIHKIDNTVLKFPFHTRINSLDETPEVDGGSPKEIWLFGNPKESYYESNSNSTEYKQTEKIEGLERGVMYDVVAKVINPDVDEMDIKVFVSVIPWHESDQYISDNGSDPSQPEGDNNIGVNPWEFEGDSSEM
ncbi:MAG: hypothetical protein J1F12_08830 [Muribaculaceae bacterium]|nr:hypothetical protein [Muribaculaceae bacterium]